MILIIISYHFIIAVKNGQTKEKKQKQKELPITDSDPDTDSSEDDETIKEKKESASSGKNPKAGSKSIISGQGSSTKRYSVYTLVISSYLEFHMSTLILLTFYIYTLFLIYIVSSGLIIFNILSCFFCIPPFLNILLTFIFHFLFVSFTLGKFEMLFSN